MHLTLALLPLFSALALAQPRTHLARAPSNPTPYQPVSIEQFSYSRSQGPTTNPNIQNYHASSIIRLTFPKLGDDPNLQCRLEMDLNGKNSQASWTAWLPDYTASVSVSAVEDGEVASDALMHMNLSTVDSGSGLNVTFDPESVPCNQLGLIELSAEGSNTLILGWEQDASLPEGFKMVAGV